VSTTDKTVKRVLMRRLSAEYAYRQRAAVVLRHVLDLSYGEVARIMGCSEDAAKMLYHRALKALKQAVSKEGV